MNSDLKYIAVSALDHKKNAPIIPIPDLNIPNITIPQHLTTKRIIENTDTISTYIRPLFNSITKENILQVREELRRIIIAKAHSIEKLDEVANEILENFLISEKNIKNYMQLLNAVYNASILIADAKTPDKRLCSVGNLFLDKCKNLIYKSIHKNNIEKLSKLDLDDNDQLDVYNREREKIINLILTLCELYNQRNEPLIKLNGKHLFYVIKFILDTHHEIRLKLIEIGNPYEDDPPENNNLEEEEWIESYESLNRMCNLYAEQICIFLNIEGKQFRLDKNIIDDPSYGKELNLSSLIDRFHFEVFPFITEPYIKSKYDNLKNL